MARALKLQGEETSSIPRSDNELEFFAIVRQE